MTTRNHRVRFCDNNLAAGSAATVAASSALSTYPLSNLLTDQRFRTWKPAGNFTISSANNKLYINDGSDKTITLTSANYSGGAALASHIQTQLNASSSNWTCTYSTTTYRFTLNRSSGTKTLKLATTANAVWSTIGYTGSIDASAGTAADEIRNHTSEYVDIDLGVASAITFFGLLGPLGEIFSLSSGATVRLYGNTTSTMTSPALTVTLTPDVHGVYKFLDDQTDTTYRYWRFEFIDKTNTAGPESFQFGHLYLGDYTTIERRNVANGFEKKMVDTSEAVSSQNGALYFQTGLKYMAFESVSIQYMDASDRRELEQVFYDLGRSTPFYVSMDPTLIVSDDASEFTRYVVFDQEPTFTHIRSDIYSVRMSFREVM
jgi:hypothetical protein